MATGAKSNSNGVIGFSESGAKAIQTALNEYFDGLIKNVEAMHVDKTILAKILSNNAIVKFQEMEKTIISKNVDNIKKAKAKDLNTLDSVSTKYKTMENNNNTFINAAKKA